VLSLLGFADSARDQVVPLAFHVDYWNRIGWTDPFSSREWTLRQDAYSRELQGDGNYTPQLVVNGQVHFPGGNRQRVVQAIQAEAGRRAVAKLALSPSPDDSGRSSLRVGVTAEVLEPVPAQKLVALVALFENGLETRVGSGENGGRTLKNDFVVRRLVKALSLEPRPGRRGEVEVKLNIERAWKRENLGLAVFLQDPGSMKIYGAARRAAF
jgi:hypothetical protein